MKPKMIRGKEHTDCVQQIRNPYILGEKPLGKRSLWRPMNRWEIILRRILQKYSSSGLK
jgi:hypothetical protein